MIVRNTVRNNGSIGWEGGNRYMDVFFFKNVWMVVEIVTFLDSNRKVSVGALFHAVARYDLCF